MDLVIIGDTKFENVFDKILPKEGYCIAQIDGVEFTFFNEKFDFINSLKKAKQLGACKVLEITKNELDKDREYLAENMGFVYSGFSVLGTEEYIKPLLKTVLKKNKKINSGLSERENEVLSLVGLGLTNKEIAQKLYLSEKTVKNHLNSIFKKIDVENRTNAALYAVKNNLVEDNTY